MKTSKLILKRNRVLGIAMLLLLGIGCTTQGKDTGYNKQETQVILAKTPPMGWNSFDSYGVYLHEKAAMENVEAMAKKLI
jgi:hypothetical protein